MLVNYAYLVKLHPTKRQRAVISMFGGIGRWVWNQSLALDTENYEKGIKKLPNHTKRCAWAKRLKLNNQWLKQASDWVIQQKLMDLCTAWSRFFEGLAEKPNFKRKNQHSDSFRFPQHFKVDLDSKRIYLPKIGWVHFKDKLQSKKQPHQRSIIGELRSITVSQKPDGWYASILVEQEINPSRNRGTAIGLDWGLRTTITTSDGKTYQNPRSLKKYLRELRRLSRTLSRREKGSRKREKARKRLARLDRKIANSRKDWLHKTSTQLAKNHSLICVETLAIKEMAKDRSKARSVADSGWSLFVNMLGYKTIRQGGRLVKVDRWFPSSKKCSSCGMINYSLKRSDRQWTCPACNTRQDRDGNAAVNILVEGRRISTVGQTGIDASGDRRLQIRSYRSQCRSKNEEPTSEQELSLAT